MYWDDHSPPHFHVQYGDAAAVVAIQSGVVMSGHLPRRQLKLVLAWAELHSDELMENWELARSNKQLRSIEGLR